MSGRGTDGGREKGSEMRDVVRKEIIRFLASGSQVILLIASSLGLLFLIFRVICRNWKCDPLVY